jgi:hypothetical protein
MTRRGSSSLGCLLTMLIVAAVLYFGVNIGEVYWHAYEFQDDMRQEAQFAKNVSNDSILHHLRSDADSLGLPDDAQAIAIRRTQGSISIHAEYDERIELPMHATLAHFHPHADGPL